MRCNCSREAFSLVETVAAIGLLATMLVSILTAFSVEARAIEFRKRQLEATELVDKQLYDWTSTKGGIPVPAAGSFANRNDLYWRTSYLQSANRQLVGAEVVRLEVTSRNSRGDRIQLFFVDLFVATALPSKESNEQAL